MGYVVKSWNVGTKTNENGNYVEIMARKSGIVSWFLALIKISPTIIIIVNQHNFIYERGSWRGKEKKIIPFSKISSVYYGYTKPWQEALFISIVLGSLTFFIFGVGAIVGIIYYILYKTLSIGICEISGVRSGIDINRSVIEGQKLDEKDAEKVCIILEKLITRYEKASVSYSQKQVPAPTPKKQITVQSKKRLVSLAAKPESKAVL